MFLFLARLLIPKHQAGDMRTRTGIDGGGGGGDVNAGAIGGWSSAKTYDSYKNSLRFLHY